jgi:hypothetical protein
MRRGMLKRICDYETEGKRPLRRTRRRLENNIKIDFREVEK